MIYLKRNVNTDAPYNKSHEMHPTEILGSPSHGGHPVKYIRIVLMKTVELICLFNKLC